MISTEKVQAIAAQAKPEPVPPCAVCGGPLRADMGGYWICSKSIDDNGEMADQEHYKASLWQRPEEQSAERHALAVDLLDARARLAALTRERDDLRCMVTRLLAVIQQYGGARGSSFSELIANARAVATGCEIDTNGRCSLERLRRSNRERDDARDEVLAERARAEKARGDAVEECAKVCDAYADEDRATEQQVAAALLADKLRALAHDEGRGTP